MTTVEAINELEWISQNGFTNDLNIVGTDRILDAIKTGIEALQKQTPMKPDTSYDGYADGYPVIDYICPCCGREIDDTDHHCICGQTIDWSEEDDK